MKNSLLTIFFIAFATLLNIQLIFAQADICGIRLGPSTQVATFAHGQKVIVDFDYEVDELGGARIFVRPFTDGSLSPGYSASGSPLFMGTGSDEGNFTITTGEVHVDEIRIRVTNADQSTILREMWVPVDYYFSENGVNNFQFSANPKASSLLLNEKFEITFDYQINHAGGARIFIRPFTDGALTPGYAASGSAGFTGSGTKTVNFSINSGTNVQVDSLRVMMTNDDQSVTLREFFIPVNLYFSTVKIEDLMVMGSNFAANGENRTIDFNYETTVAGGVRIFPRPWTNGGLTPGYGACGSPSLTGSGNRTCNFTINNGNQYVDHIRFQAFNDDQSELLLEVFFPVNNTFGEVLIDNLKFCPQSPVRMDNGERVNISFTVQNNTGADIRIFPRPFTEGGLTPGYGASGSSSYGAGATNSDAFFTINSGDARVDQIRFRITNADQSEILGDFFLETDFVFGSLSTGIEEELVLSQFKVYPNPFKELIQVDFTPIVSEQIQVELADLAGRTIGVIAHRNMPAGLQQSLSVDAHNMNLTPGVYMLIIKGKTFSTARKVVFTP